ncbi:MAG: ACT domain-containing protein [Oscillospiraceae bacterium]
MNGVSKISTEQTVMLVNFTDTNCKADYPAVVLTAFAQNKIVVDMISQVAPNGNNVNFSFTVSEQYFDDVMQTIQQLKKEFNKMVPLISSGYTKINLFGGDMVTCCGVAAKALSALVKADIDITLITTSDLDISLLIRAEDEDSAVELLSKEFAINI